MINFRIKASGRGAIDMLRRARIMPWIRLLVLALMATVTQSSRGDEDPDYKYCVANCVNSRQCSSDPYTIKGLPLHLGLMGWNCLSNCKYDCMWHIVEQSRAADYETFQYHGKWPFIRVFGFQEIASVLFSAANAYAHLVGYRSFRRTLGKAGLSAFFLSWHYKVYFFASVIAWISAMLFHTRDVPWTEHADYLTAISTVFIGLYTAVLRHLLVANGAAQILIAAPFAGLLAYHLRYMLFVSFDYGWNMELLAVMFGTFALIWFTWGVRNFSRCLEAKLAILWVIGAALCGLLEIFDFEPVADLVDAHALWHAGTVPLVLLIWKIYALDAEHLLKYPNIVKGTQSVM